MDAWLPSCVPTLMQGWEGWLALPAVGLGSLFVAAFLSATLLPLGSEALLIAVLRQHPQWWWPALLVAAAGNTLGGAFTWWMGRGARRLYERAHDGIAHAADVPARDARAADAPAPAAHPAVPARAAGWLQRFGPAACLLSWLPVVGDPLCAAAGWLRLPFLPCVACMAIGKFARYAALAATLAAVF